MNEASAIKLCLLYRDTIGFEFLAKKYRREAFFHALSLLGNLEDAEDACQESFAKAFAAMPRLTGLDNFYPWFYRILRNCCLNMISRKKTSEKYKHSNFGRDTVLKADSSNAAVLLEKNDEQLAVWRVLKELKPEFREILVMKYIKDNNYDEISKCLEIPRGTVMSRLYHARKAFREEYLKLDEIVERKEVR